MSINSKRKLDHINICSTEDAAFRYKTTGFENYEFVPYAISELTTDDISLSCSFFGKTIDLPFMISCMTGGVNEAVNINKELAIAAEALNIPIGVGSQRQLLSDAGNLESFKTIREHAPNVPLLGNIGAAEIVKFKDETIFVKLAEMIDADAMVIHLNLMQEFVQSEGNPNFKGLLNKIEMLSSNVHFPIIVKEVGFGIDVSSAKQLLNVGVNAIDVAGSGGTSWSKVERLRNGNSEPDLFDEWGLPTSYCIRTISQLKNEYEFLLIGSGGINSGVDAAKAIALGADISASGRHLFKLVINNGSEAVINELTEWSNITKRIMVLTGSQELSKLRKQIISKRELY